MYALATLGLQTFHPAPLGGLVMMILVLAVIGVCLYLLFHYVPMDPPIKIAIQVIVVICVILWLLRSFGLF